MLLDNIFKAHRKVLPMDKAHSPTVTEHHEISHTVDESLMFLAEYIHHPADLVIHRINDEAQLVAAVVYLDSLADAMMLGTQVIEPLNTLVRSHQGLWDPQSAKLILASAKVAEFDDLHDAINELLAGQTLLFLADSDKVLTLFFPGFPRRQIEEPKTEKVFRGPREGFTEVLSDNLGMVRRWLKDPNLKVEVMIIGERTKTGTAILYLNDVANPDIVSEVRERLKQISLDGILDSAYISQMITDNRLTIFPLIQETERPDKVVAALLEGRVAVLVDKSSFGLIVPVTSNEFYQTPEDFFLNYWVGSFLRLIRGIGTFTSVTLPSVYVSIITINPELLPPTLILVLASGRTQVPYPAIIETLLALLIFEMFREAVIRVPTNVNLILGIAGGVLLGITSIQSGLVSAATVVIVVITVLASFSTANTSKEQAWRLVRYFLLLAGNAFGLLGLTMAGLVVLTHMVNLKSFGVSYLAPWAPPLPVDMVDAFLVIPPWASYRRPPTYRPRQEDRLGETEGEDNA